MKTTILLLLTAALLSSCGFKHINYTEEQDVAWVGTKITKSPDGSCEKTTSKAVKENGTLNMETEILIMKNECPKEEIFNMEPLIYTKSRTEITKFGRCSDFYKDGPRNVDFKEVTKYGKTVKLKLIKSCENK